MYPIPSDPRSVVSPRGGEQEYYTTEKRIGLPSEGKIRSEGIKDWRKIDHAFFYPLVFCFNHII